MQQGLFPKKWVITFYFMQRWWFLSILLFCLFCRNIWSILRTTIDWCKQTHRYGGFFPFYFFVCFVEIYGVYYGPQLTGANKLTGKKELVILRKAWISLFDPGFFLLSAMFLQTADRVDRAIFFILFFNCDFTYYYSGNVGTVSNFWTPHGEIIF